jgi:hypothetical protein
MAHRVSNPDWATNLALRTMEDLAANYGTNSGSGNRLNMAMGAGEEHLGPRR